MFDLSMPELAVIGVVALLVLGPERLPGAARTVGALLRRAQRSWSGLRADIERELAADELKRQLKQTQDEIGLDNVKRDLGQARDAIARDLDPRPQPAATPAIPPVGFPSAPLNAPIAPTPAASTPAASTPAASTAAAADSPDAPPAIAGTDRSRDTPPSLPVAPAPDERT